MPEVINFSFELRTLGERELILVASICGGGEGGTLGEGKSNPTQPCPRSHLDTGTSYKEA